MESTPSEALPVRDVVVAHKEGADDRGGLAEDIVEAVVLVGVILGDDLAVVRAESLDAAWNMPTRIARIQNSTADFRKNAAKNTMHMYATTAAVIITLQPNRPAKRP